MKRLLPLLLLVGCHSAPDFGFAVAVTLHFQFDPAQVSALDLFIDGDEQNEAHKTTDKLGRQFQTTERWVYQPAASSKKLTLSAAARQADAVVGSGSQPVTLKSGETVEVTLEITAVTPPDLGMTDDGGESDGSALDASDDAPPAVLCTVAGCAALSKGCDPAVGCVSCPALPSGASHFYVDSASFANAPGTIECPFVTITAGLNAAAMSSTLSTKTVHVAAGNYVNETFPLEVPGNTTLDGAGIGKTLITGIGNDSKGLGTGPSTIVSDPNATSISKISNLSMRPSTLASFLHPVGILCYGGNAPKTYTVGPAASTLVDAVELYGYENAIQVRSLNDGVTQGCNLLLTRSSVHNGVNGVSAYGCDAGHSSGLPVGVSLGLFQNPSSGNSFYNLTNSTNDAAALIGGDCTAFAYAYENDLHDSSGGIYFNVPIGSHLDVEHNQFHALTTYGLWARGNSFLSILANNSFTNIGGVAPQASSCHASAICLEDSSQLTKGQGNLVVNNDHGVEIAGSALAGQRASLGFGDGAGIGGSNTFACNSNGSDGHDVWIHVTGVSSNKVYLADNQWDRAVPSGGTGDGSDLLLTSPAPMVMSAPAASPYPSPCAFGHQR